ncbi:conjugal transfer protein TrbL family protein [Butyricicoccus faecihominis]|uniref:conjugal transfer protein TrbL family protein n=1 Tax=Butyricicoccus faecihominis TaxID=1712515 RepID=UPI003AF3DDF0
MIILEIILVLLIVAVLNGAVAFIDSMLADLVPMTLHADQYMTAAGGGSMVDVLFEILLGFGVSLIILKFLKKGFECYVMWTDGDPDSEPVQLIIRFVQAIAVAVCFPVMYGWLADITENLTNQLITAIGASTNYDWQAWVNGLSSAGLVTAIFGLVFVICYFILYFQFLMRGVEIMILRIGLPLACSGLLDNDKGVFKTYLTKFFQSTAAVMVQISLCKLGVGMMMNVGINLNVFWGIACLVLAIKTPKFLSEFMVPTGGGGGMVNNIYHSVRLVGMAKNMMK